MNITAPTQASPIASTRHALASRIQPPRKPSHHVVASPNPAWVHDAQAMAQSVAKHPLVAPLVSPLRAAVHFFAPPRAVSAKPITPFGVPNSAVFGAAARPDRAAPASTMPQGAASNDANICAARSHHQQLAAAPAVRVVRVVDAQLPRGAAGRMRISGRIDQVCAELERLCALEIRAA